MEPVEIDKALRLLLGVGEKTISVPHEIRHIIVHLQLLTYLNPVYIVNAVVKVCDILHVPEIAVNAKIKEAVLDIVNAIE